MLYAENYKYYISLVVFAALSGLVTLLAYAFFPHTGHVNELTVSGGVFTDANKFRDIALPPIMMVIQLAGAFGLWWWFASGRAPQKSTGMTSGKTLLLILMLTVAFYCLTLLAIKDHLTLFAIALIGGGAAVLHRTDPGRWSATFAVAVLLAAAVAWVADNLLEIRVIWVFPPAICALCALAAAAPAHRKLLPPLYGLGAAATALQLALSAPFFWLPPELRDGVTELDALTWAMSALALLVAALHCRRSFSASSWGLDAVPPFSLAVAYVVIVTMEFGAFALPTDDYHYGEALLSTLALRDGWGLFSTFFTPHGLSDALGIFGAWLPGELSATGVEIGQRHVLLLARILLFWRLFAILGPLVGLGVGLALTTEAQELLPLLVFVLILELGALKRDYLAGVLCAILSAFGVFFLNGPGVAMAAPAILTVILLFRSWEPASIARFLAAGLVTGVVIIAVFWSEIVGQLWFLSASSRTNLVVYGNNNINLWAGPRRLISIAVLLLFAFAPLLAFSLLSARRNENASVARQAGRLLISIAPVLLLALLWTPYAMARLDHDAVRAYIASMNVLGAMTVWIAAPRLRAWFPSLAGAGLRAGQGLLVLLLFLSNGMNWSQIDSWTRDGLAPPRAMASTPLINPELPRLGYGAFDEAHVQRILAVRDMAESVLAPGETYLDLTNRNALYFYLGRTSPVAIPSTYNAAPEAFQKRFVEDARAAAPPLALVEVDSIYHDGQSLPLRAYWIYRHLIEDYAPIADGDHLYGLRRDLAERLDALIREPISLEPVSDDDWRAGVAIGRNAENWSFLLPDRMAGSLRVGDALDFSDGVTRVVTAARGARVRTEPGLPAAAGSAPSFAVRERSQAGTEAELWARALHRDDLGHIPSAWGRSLPKLAGKLAPQADALQLGGAGSLAPAEGGATYRVTGADPHWLLTPAAGIDPGRQGILALDIACGEAAARPRLRVSWRAAGEPFSEDRSVAFTASFPTNLVPLDASPRWLLATSIDEIRVALDGESGCETVSFGAARLMERLRDWD